MLTMDTWERTSRMLGLVGGGPLLSITPLAGGANNRVFLVETEQRQLLLKAYFRDPADTRDRLKTEFDFCRYVWQKGVRSIPQPLASDPDAGLGLFEYVTGRISKPGEIDQQAVEQAIAFFQDINRHRHDADNAGLPDASEACFSIRGHLDLVHKRIQRLESMSLIEAIDSQAHYFVEHQLLPAWNKVLLCVHEQIGLYGLSLDAVLDQHDRCLSPSDFGYHNAIRQEDGSLKFVDFEYSGWDDPAKLICDFFCQPAVPVPQSYFEYFAQSIARCFVNAEFQRVRSVVLLPIYRMKWCCIVLNEFLPAGHRRRLFSQPEEQTQRKIRQLDKARTILSLITECDLSRRNVA